MSSNGVPQPQPAVVVDDDDGMPSLAEADAASTSWMTHHILSLMIQDGNHRLMIQDGNHRMVPLPPSLHVVLPSSAAVPKAGA